MQDQLFGTFIREIRQADTDMIDKFRESKRELVEGHCRSLEKLHTHWTASRGFVNQHGRINMTVRSHVWSHQVIPCNEHKSANITNDFRELKRGEKSKDLYKNKWDSIGLYTENLHHIYMPSLLCATIVDNDRMGAGSISTEMRQLGNFGDNIFSRTRARSSLQSDGCILVNKLPRIST